MNLKHLLITAVCAAAALSASAQGQGYLDGVDYFKVEQYDNAREILERTLNDGSTDKATAYYYLGQIALFNNDQATAQDYFNKGISADSKNGLNYVGMGALALKQGNAAEAKNQFKAAVKADKSAETNVAVARAYFNADPVLYAKEYEDYMKDASKRDKSCPDIYVMQGDKYLAEKQIGDAAAAYENAIFYTGNNVKPEAYVKYANAYVHANPKLTVSKLEELLEKMPNSALAQREYAEKLYETDHWSDAAVEYGKYMKNPNHFIQDEERYVALLYFGKKYAQSYKLAGEILAKNPESFQMRRMRFLNQVDMGHNAAAMERAKEFFAMTPPANNRFTSNDYTQYARLLNKMDREDEALPYFEKAVETNPDKADAYRDLADAYYKAKNYEGAVANQEKYMAAGESDYYDYYTISGYYMTHMSKMEAEAPERAEIAKKAIAAIDSSLVVKGEDPRYQQRKARILIVANNNEIPEEAVQVYNVILEQLNKDPENLEKYVNLYKESYQMIAGYYHKNKDFAKAVEYYEKMLELDPENEALKKYVDNLRKRI